MQEMIHSLGADEFVEMGKENEGQNVDKKKYDSTLKKKEMKKSAEKKVERRKQDWIDRIIVDVSEREENEEVRVWFRLIICLFLMNRYYVWEM